jgi:hypothetical protein
MVVNERAARQSSGPTEVVYDVVVDYWFSKSIAVDDPAR